MATEKKSATTTTAKKAQVKVADMKPAKDAKGGARRGGSASKHQGLLAQRSQN